MPPRSSADGPLRDTLEPGPAHLAMRHHARSQAGCAAALPPVALGKVNLADGHAPIAAMPMPPPDAGAFFCCAGGHDDPSVLAPARSALRSPADLAIAVTIQRRFRIQGTILDRHAALQHALRGRTWNGPAPIRALPERFRPSCDFPRSHCACSAPGAPRALGRGVEDGAPSDVALPQRR